MLTSEKLKEWYGMPKFQPSQVDEEILVIIDEVAQLEVEIAKLNYIELPNEKVSNVFDAYLAWKSKVAQLEADNAALQKQNIMENKINFGLDEEVQALQKQVEGLREIQNSIVERAERIFEGETWNLAEFVVRKTKE